MPQLKEVQNRVDENLYNLKIFEELDQMRFTPDTTFLKFAAVEVKEYDKEPLGFDRYVLLGGLYAVFLHQGPASLFNQTLQFIYEEWFPDSPYELDDREHFERFTKDYHPNDPESVEEVWIPLKRK
jgi:AraC family transcriptional regulator